MNSFLKGISLFIARGTDAGTLAAAGPSAIPADCESPPRPTSRLPAVTPSNAESDSFQAAAAGRAVANRASDASTQANDPDSAAELLPRVAYPIPDIERAPRKARSARSQNMLQSSTNVAVVPHPMPMQTKAARAHGSHTSGVVLTETERVRLQVMQVQIRLSSVALYEGPIDGILGSETVTGLRHFQVLKGMRDTGLLTAGTLSALGVAPIV